MLAARQILIYYGQIEEILPIIANMPRKPPIIFPQEQSLLSALGERLRLARKRRKLSNAVVAQRAGISRTTLYKVEAGDPGATLGSYIRVLAVLGLEDDLNQLGADDRVGRKLQDLALEPVAPKRRSATRAKTVKSSSASNGEEPT
ncbi:helix-turn-helix domain-containing protein [Pollutimonas sp. H1-120]|uniref:helix-turn-helix domain-containing protein n=1 Tax=Pollutimonas sp. H1-120 TaxID=3148824 RepID=UPI003B525730